MSAGENDTKHDDVEELHHPQRVALETIPRRLLTNALFTCTVQNVSKRPRQMNLSGSSNFDL